MEWPSKVEKRWRELVDEAFTGMKGWRLEHPKATFKEIETVLDGRLAKVRAQMLADAAALSALTDISRAAPEERPRCPRCGEVLEARGLESRSLVTNFNETITLERSWACCPSCGTGLFPPGPRTGTAAG
jgi:ribosomal protein S27AE